MDTQTPLPFAIALGIGLLMGVERERRKRGALARRTAGVRTFALTSWLGAVAMYLGGALLVGLAAAALGLLLLAHARAAGTGQGMATQAALLLNLLLGGLCLRDPVLASGLAVTAAILLAARTRLHRFVRKVLSREEMVDGLILAAAALVVLPMLPDAYLGPFQALNLRTVWKFTVLVMAVSAAGHVALRLFGPRIGLPLAGFASGFISSTVTIGAMGQRVAAEPSLMGPAVAGAVLSSISTLVLMAAVLLAISPATLQALLLPLACSGAAALAYGAMFLLRAMRQPPATPVEPGRPFKPQAALMLALIAAAVLVGAAALNAWLGQRGIALAALLGGFVDTHAAAASVATLAAADRVLPAQTVVPVLAALSANALSKAVFAAASGGRRFAAQVVPGLLLMIMAAWAGYAVG
ncbi:MgtC/SapB family protein [Achromobacter ruhlandii]|uniref:MgtC/SapB family protein n=1 Tax=Achromobacter ruhlandii TaxID=72557 RepID=A0A848NLJ6_9BURK|nr:MgtC/SapB family protein [Achromobacter ruhlandii]NMU91954.1 MgtC/SapB family protein [Achromobacter ruhlandii]